MDGRSQAQQQREARIRQGMTLPGPKPRGSQGDPSLLPAEGETLDRLSGDFCILQLKRGHRYSTDDLLCAYFACERLEEQLCARGCPPDEAPARLRSASLTVFDLGSGIGSVPLFLAWRLEGATISGIEAQAISHAMAQRSLRYNGVEGRVSIALGDLRHRDQLPRGVAQLVTGTPPYFLDHEGTVSALPQRGPCRFEQRGGVEEYLRSAAQLLAPGGVCVLVQPWRDLDRMAEEAARLGLALGAHQPILFKEGRAPLVGLFSFVAGAARRLLSPLVIRGADERYPEAYRAVRRKMGFPTR